MKNYDEEIRTLQDRTYTLARRLGYALLLNGLAFVFIAVLFAQSLLE